MAKVVALIPARGGSKGLPGKHLLPLMGKPVLAYTIEAALGSGVCDEVIVTSDSREILELAEEFYAAAHIRPSFLAQDDTPTAPVIAEFVRARQLVAEDIIVLLQPTSPLRNSSHICNAYTLFADHADCKAVVSVFSVPNKFLKAYLREGEYLQPAFQLRTAYQRRQDLPELFMPNGAIYIFTVGDFSEKDRIPEHEVVPFVMAVDESHDIDTREDLQRCAQLLSVKAESSTLQ